MENKENSIKYLLSKYDFELYKDEDNLQYKSYEVKRVKMPNSGEAYKFIENNTTFFTLNTYDLTEQENKYLKTVDGFKLLINLAKQNVKDLNVIKQIINSNIK